MLPLGGRDSKLVTPGVSATRNLAHRAGDFLDVNCGRRGSNSWSVWEKLLCPQLNEASSANYMVSLLQAAPQIRFV